MDLCHVLTAPNAEVGLQLVKNTPDLAAVFSDFFMPGMDGVSFLSEVRKLNPDITRVMITGAAGLSMAIDSVNVGQVFRFLIKPCPSDVFIQTVREAIRQNELITTERNMLNKTLNGAIKTLVDVLSLFSPEVFAQASRLREMAHQMAIHLKEEQVWEVELAALLCQIGCVTVPRDVLEKNLHGEPLSPAEKEMINGIPEGGRLLIRNIPRMEKIAQAIYFQNQAYQSSVEAAQRIQQDIPRISYILNLLLDYDRHLMKLNDPVQAFNALHKDSAKYDPELLQIFRDQVLRLELMIKSGKFQPVIEEEEINITELVAGSILSRNVLDTNKRMVVTRYTKISEILKMRLVNYFLSHRIERTVWIISNIR
jgi:response regulator RpfG family c-di-GMP phosphodiesterase